MMTKRATLPSVFIRLTPGFRKPIFYLTPGNLTTYPRIPKTISHCFAIIWLVSWAPFSNNIILIIRVLLKVSYYYCSKRRWFLDVCSEDNIK